jgi:hypothetical protein
MESAFFRKVLLRLALTWEKVGQFYNSGPIRV